MCQSESILVRLQSMCEARNGGCSMGGLVTTSNSEKALRLANSLLVLIAGAEQGAKPRNIESSKPIKKTIDLMLRLLDIWKCDY